MSDKKKYSVTVYVQYDDFIEVEADNEDQARALAEEQALNNMGVFASAEIRADTVEEA